MSDPQITLCVASYNAKYALAGMWESYCHFNPEWPAKLFVLDNGSIDGAREYAERHADLLLTANNSRSHGVCLTELGRRVETEYMLTIDNDIRFKAPGCMTVMMDNLDPATTWAVCPHRPNTPKDSPITEELKIGYSPNICVGLFRTATFQKVCKELDLGYAGDFTTGAVWETGGLAWRVARTHGLDSVEMAGLWNYVEHFGNMSTLWHHVPNYPSLEGMMDGPEIWGLEIYNERYGRVKSALAEIRGCSVEELEAHEPEGPNHAVVEDLGWEWIKVYHPFLVAGAGIR